MKSVVGKLKSDIEILEQRVNAKEMILKSVFSNLESVGNEHQLVRKVFGVTPKVSCAPSYVSLKENWCVGFEDTICVSFNATNISKDNQMRAVCSVLSSSSVVQCILLNGNGSCIPFIRLPGWYCFTHSDITGQLRPVETHGVEVKRPSTWCSLEDFMSAKENDMRQLLRCLRVSSYVYSLKPSSSFDFGEANPDFYCCDYGDWQVFVGNKLMSGLIATSSSFDHPNANIDRIYGLNTELLDAFVRRSKS